MNRHEVPVLAPPRELTQETLPLFERVTAAYPDGVAKGIVLDLTDVRLISSAGLSHLVVVGRRLDEGGACLALAGGSRQVVRLFQTVGLDRFLPLFSTIDEASAYVRDRAAGSA